MDLDSQRKRTFFSWITLLAVIVFPVLMLYNIYEKDEFEALIDLFFLASILICFFILKASRTDALIYRANLFFISAALLYSIHIGIGGERMLYWPFAIPVLYFFFLGKSEGLLWTGAFAATLTVPLLMPSLFDSYPFQPGTIPRFYINFTIIVVLSLGLEASRDRISRLLAENNRILELEKSSLEQALKQVKTLRGLIPICSICKNIRDDKGYWEQVDIFIRNHSEAVFSHSICPECLEKHYPEIDFAPQPGRDALPD